MDNREYIPLVIFAVTLFALVFTWMLFDPIIFYPMWAGIFALYFFGSMVAKAFSLKSEKRIDGWLRIPDEEHPGTPLLSFSDRTILREGTIYKIKCEFLTGEEEDVRD